MSQQYTHLVVPARLVYHPSRKHCYGIVQDLARNDNLIATSGNLKGVLGTSEDSALQKLKEDSAEFISARFGQDGLAASDFSLVYAASEIQDGRVWTVTSVTSEVRL